MPWYLTDEAGSVHEIVGSNGTLLDRLTYSLFGELLSETNPTYGDRFKYAGGAYAAATGLAQFGLRYVEGAQWACDVGSAFTCECGDGLYNVGKVKFFLPAILGAIKQASGSFSTGFLAFAVVGGLGGAAALTFASSGWKGIFIQSNGKARDHDQPLHTFVTEPQLV